MIGPNASLRRFIVEAPPWDQLIDSLELRHPGWSQSFVLANYFKSLRLRFEDGRVQDSIPLGFAVELPGAGTKGRQDMQVAIDNVSAEIWQALEIAQAQPEFPITLVWRAFLRTDLNAPCAQPITLAAYQVSATLTGIQLTAQRSDAINMRWPNVVYRPERWPGLLR
jgi:hypothetical protein